MKKIRDILKVEDTTLEILGKVEALDNDASIGYKNKIALQEKMLEIAVKKAKTAYDYEECDCSIEMNYYGDERDPYEWSEEVRVESFIVNGVDGLMAVVNKQKSQPAYKEFLNFLEIEGLENPIDGMVESLSGMMQSDSDV